MDGHNAGLTLYSLLFLLAEVDVHKLKRPDLEKKLIVRSHVFVKLMSLSRDSINDNPWIWRCSDLGKTKKLPGTLVGNSFEFFCFLSLSHSDCLPVSLGSSCKSWFTRGLPLKKNKNNVNLAAANSLAVPPRAPVL